MRTVRQRFGIAGVVVLLAGGAAASFTGAAPSAAAEQFSFSAKKLSPAQRKRVTGVSWHRGCPVGLGRLRYLRIAYHGFDGRIHRGELIANETAVKPLKRAVAS